MIRRLNILTLAARDLPRANAFYRDALGLPLASRLDTKNKELAAC